MSTHSFIAPSSADIWVNCPGSPLLSSPYADTPTQDAAEGEAAHWVVSTVLTSYLKESTQLIMPSSVIDQKASNRVVINGDMVEAAEIMIDDVLDTCQEFGLLQSLHIEEHLELPGIHPKCHGTPDAWAWDAENKSLFLWDFKYGHKSIPADNWQNKCYVSGILSELGIDGLAAQSTSVTMTIIQPRSYHDDGPIKSVTLMASDLRGDFNLLETAAIEAFSSNPNVKTGDHCRYCLARHSCPANDKAAMASVDYSMAAVPQVLSQEGLSFELHIISHAIKTMEYRYEALVADAIGRIEHGADVPGFGIKNGKGNREFDGKIEDLVAMGDLVGVDMRAKPKAITPAEFDRRVKAVNKERETPIDSSTFDGFIKRKSTGLKLVPSEETDVIKAFKRK